MDQLGTIIGIITGIVGVVGRPEGLIGVPIDQDAKGTRVSCSRQAGEFVVRKRVEHGGFLSGSGTTGRLLHVRKLLGP